MVQRENELRVSDVWQLRFRGAEERQDTDWMECAAALQVEVVREFGFGPDAANILRSAASLFPKDPFFKEVPLYVRYNRSRNGSMCEGSVVPKLDLLCLDGTRRPLSDLGGDKAALVLIAGSHS